MKVWVVMSDCGLNGPVVHGVYTTEPDKAAVEEFVRTERVVEEEGRDFYVRTASTTGYQYTAIEEFDLDADLA